MSFFEIFSLLSDRFGVGPTIICDSPHTDPEIWTQHSEKIVPRYRVRKTRNSNILECRKWSVPIYQCESHTDRFKIRCEFEHSKLEIESLLLRKRRSQLGGGWKTHRYVAAADQRVGWRAGSARTSRRTRPSGGSQRWGARVAPSARRGRAPWARRRARGWPWSGRGRCQCPHCDTTRGPPSCRTRPPWPLNLTPRTLRRRRSGARSSTGAPHPHRRPRRRHPLASEHFRCLHSGETCKNNTTHRPPSHGA
jgi:hypothetical protein